MSDLPEIKWSSLRFMLITNGIFIAWSVVSSIMALGPVSIFVLVALMVAALLVYCFLSGDRVLARLMVFGLIAGICELWADAWAVQDTHTLFYPPDEPMIMCSPAYMPFSWVIVISQLGFYSLFLTQKFGLPLASVIIAVAGGLYIPLFEHLAKDAGWWYYSGTPMIFNAPYYVILAELLLSLTIPSLVFIAVKGKPWVLPLAALLEGAWIYLAGRIAFEIILKLFP